MPPPPKSERKPKVVRKRLADGTIREYTYARGPDAPDLPEAGSVAALLIAYRASPEHARARASTRAMYDRTLRPWEGDRWRVVPVAQVKRRDILAIRDAIAKVSGPGAADAFGRVTSLLFGWALDRGWIEHSPAQRIKALSKGRLPDWGEDAIAHALDRLPADLRRVVVLGLYTGQRRADLTAMEWGHVRGERIAVTQAKTGRALLIPIHPALGAELAAWRREGAKGAILRTETGRAWTAQHLSNRMRLEMDKLGLSGLNVHGLRKAAARRLAEAGCSTHEIAAITGHATLAMVQLYTEAVRQEATAESAMRRLRVAGETKS